MALIGRYSAALLAIAGMLGGLSSIFAGCASLAQDLAHGSILYATDHGTARWQDAVALITAGAAMFSPGLAALKAGPFARKPDA